MIRPMSENETIEMSNYYTMTNASSRFAAAYNDSTILKLKIWWWNLTERQRRFYLISVLIIVLLFIIAIIIISAQHKPIDSYQTSTTTACTITATSSLTTISPSMSIISINSSVAASTMQISSIFSAGINKHSMISAATHSQLSVLKESSPRMPSAVLRMMNSTPAKSTDLLEMTKHWRYQ